MRRGLRMIYIMGWGLRMMIMMFINYVWWGRRTEFTHRAIVVYWRLLFLNFNL